MAHGNGTGSRFSTASVWRPTTDVVGRADELAALLSTVTSPPAVAFVAGEAGMGKTRLLRAAVDTHWNGNRWTAMGFCHAGTAPFRYGPVLDCLRSVGPRIAGAMLNPVTGALRPYLPEIAEILPPDPPRLDDGNAARHRLFRAVREVLVAVGPSVLVLDDVQWIDDDTRDLLRFLLADPPSGLALVLAYRPEELSDGGPLGATVSPGPATTMLRLDLRPLDVDGVRALITEAAPDAAAPGEYVAAVHRHSAGIPVVATEITHSVLAAGLPSKPSSVTIVPVPRSVAESTVRLLAELDDDAVAIVMAAAVVDEPATADLLTQVAALDTMRARPALVSALRGNVLVRLGANRYGFRHAMARRAAYERLTGPEAEDLHVRALRALRKRRPVPYVRLAEHARCAGRLADWVAYAEAAADAAAASGDAESAVGILGRLLAEPDLQPSDVDRIAPKYARVAVSGLDQHDVTDLLAKLMADHRLSDEVRGEIRLSLGLLLLRQEDGLEAGRTELELAVSELRGRPEIAARGMTVLAEPYIGLLPVEESLRWMRRSEEVLDACSDRLMRLTLLANVIANRAHTGDTAAHEMVHMLPDRVTCAREQRELARAHCNLADAWSWLGHYERARTQLANGLRLAEDCDARYIVSVGVTTELRLDWHAGDWTRLAARAQGFLESHSELLPVTSELSLVLALLAVARGEWDDATRYFEQTGLRTPANAITPVVISASAGMVRMMLSRDDPDGAVAEAAHGLDVLRGKGIWAWGGTLVPATVAAYCRAGRVEEAESLLGELRSGIDGSDAPLVRASLPACEGDIAAAHGALAEAVERYDAAYTAHTGLSQPYEAALHSESAARCRLRLNEASATELLTGVADTFDRLGATRDAARCRHLLRGNGSVTPSRRGRRGYGNELSPRERDVARLLAGNLTNREIGDVLFLSKRTVEQHVANVLRKLGKSSRSELVGSDVVERL